MYVYRICRCHFITDLSGSGSAMFGGRWHSKGTYILYTAASASLALLESVVHISNAQALEYCMICLDVPDTSIEKININTLPADWFINPPPDNLKSIGDMFILSNKSLVLQLPSAIVPEENNYLINPNHLLFKNVKIVFQRSLMIDKRLFK